jgi:hypothetical protein
MGRTTAGAAVEITGPSTWLAIAASSARVQKTVEVTTTGDVDPWRLRSSFFLSERHSTMKLLHERRRYVVRQLPAIPGGPAHAVRANCGRRTDRPALRIVVQPAALGARPFARRERRERSPENVARVLAKAPSHIIGCSAMTSVVSRRPGAHLAFARPACPAGAPLALRPRSMN